LARLEGGGKAGAMLRKLSCGSANNNNDSLDHRRSRIIDKQLRADRKRYRSTYRLLLLGEPLRLNECIRSIKTSFSFVLVDLSPIVVVVAEVFNVS